MTFLLRILSLIPGFLGIIFLVMPIMMLRHGTSPVRDVIATTAFLLLAVLAIRCAWWLWRSRRFWTEIRSLSEVAALTCFVVLWPVMAILEK
jgi:hypothetical protein